MARATGSRLVIELLPRLVAGPGRRVRQASLETALAITALWSRLRGDKRTRFLAALLHTEVIDLAAVTRLAEQRGIGRDVLTRLIGAPATTVALERSLRLADSVGATPGTLYVNGRRWHGPVGAKTIKSALGKVAAQARLLVARGVSRASVYGHLISAGRTISAAERDLASPVSLGDISALPRLGGKANSGSKRGVTVTVLVDFRSLASRAAFHILVGLRDQRAQAMSLRLAALSSDVGTPGAGAAFVVASSHGRGLLFARRLFAMREPNHRPSLRKALRHVGLRPALVAKELTGARVQAASKTVRRIQASAHKDAEPLIFIGSRRYVGPIDEASIERAIDFVGRSHRGAATKAVGSR